MPDLQRFKPNDATEALFIETFRPILQLLESDLDDFFSGAYTCFALGDVLWNLNRDPMVGVITQSAYRISFFSIHDLFTRPGTFEFYLILFRSIFGETATILFDIPSPGVLQIDISEVEIQTFSFAAREVFDNVYTISDIVDHDGDVILFQDTVGMKTQNEIDSLTKEIAPAEIYAKATLVL